MFAKAMSGRYRNDLAFHFNQNSLHIHTFRSVFWYFDVKLMRRITITQNWNALRFMMIK